MKVVAVIPARYASGRFPGKPLADICGKPMIWWVYKRVKDAGSFEDIMVSTEDRIIEEACRELGIKCFFNKETCPNVVNRLYDVSRAIPADYYLCVNGDEPIIESSVLTKGIPDRVVKGKPVMFGLMREFKSPTEVVDPGNLKLATSFDGRLIYSSRSPIPFPQNTVEYSYKKYIGVECYNQEALEFYVNAPMGPLERIESIGTLRFLEYGHSVFYTLVESDSLSVDTPKDLDIVRAVVRQELATGKG